MKKIYILILLFTTMLITGCSLGGSKTTQIGFDVYKIIFDGNGGTLVSGDEIQYVESLDNIKYPEYYYHLKEFDGFTERKDDKTILYTAKYTDLTIKDVTPEEWLNSITFGWNYVDCIDEPEVDYNKFLDFLLEKNINSVTIPVQYASLTDDKYEHLDEAYLARLKTILDLAYSKDMYVIVATYDYYRYMWSTLNYANRGSLLNIINTSLKELAMFLKDYDEKVVLSFLCEPRDYDDNGLDKEAYWVLNDANAEFVKMFRSTGGNNVYRNLIITTGWSQHYGDSAAYFKMVDDDHTIVRINTYEPFEFVHDDDYLHISWTAKEKEYKTQVSKIFFDIKENFLDKGIPVYIGEFGSRDKNNDNQRALWLEYFISCAKAFGIPCYSWDSAAVNRVKEFSFSMINRDDFSWTYPVLGKKIEDLVIDNKYIPIFEEQNEITCFVGDDLPLLTQVTNIKTKEKVNITLQYDNNFFTKNSNMLTPINVGETYLSFKYNNYNYYIKCTILADSDKTITSFTMEPRFNNDANAYQIYITSTHMSEYRQDYDWYSSDTSILEISKYSTITIHKDGTCFITAINKENKKCGVVVVTIEGGQIVSYSSVINEGKIINVG